MVSFNILRLTISVGVTLAVGFIGSLFTTPSISTWYTTLNKPSFNPPNWIFGPVWTLLFIMMAISFYLVWQKGLTLTAVLIFVLQLILNILWSLFFFYLKNPALALMEIIFLWLAILANIVIFYSISKTTGFLLVPYILWVSFAAFLNYTITSLNPK